MARDTSKPGVQGLTQAHVEKANGKQSGVRKAEPAHYRKSSDSNRKHYGPESIINRGK
jgi:hypothetical protein